jgi:RimJ/RimL family protein N-acetyltransferase
MTFETERLILRPWNEKDAQDLYELAKDPKVGPAAGWPVHTSVDNSREIIGGVLSEVGTYAVTLKGEDKAIGSVGLMTKKQSNIDITEKDAEIGYWIGVPYWGKGYIPEAVNALIKYAFEEENIDTIWCGYFEGNEKSRRVQEKCGFVFHHTEEGKYWPITGEYKTEHISQITKKQWEEKSSHI